MYGRSRYSVDINAKRYVSQNEDEYLMGMTIHGVSTLTISIDFHQQNPTKLTPSKG